MRVFVSYRRDDAGGHAGRLADDLGERLPDATVFQDVESIGPGVDFVAAVKQAIEGADAVLVVIGPDWATMTEPTGGIRLMQTNDIVRLEVATALGQNKWVIPVLVGGAEMPGAVGLPPELAPLTQRNAVDVRPVAWNEDVDRLAAALGGQQLQPRRTAGAALSTRSSTARRGWVWPAVALAVGVAVAVVVWKPWAGSGATGDDGPSTVGDATVLEVPAPARTLLHGPTGERLEVEVTAASVGDGPEPVVDVMTHIRNLGAYDVAIGGATMLLEVDGQTVAPHEFAGEFLVARTEADVPVTYELSAVPNTLVLQIRYFEDVGQIPLVGESLTSPPPEVRPDAVTVTAGTVDYGVGPATIEVMSDRYVVSVPIQVTNNGQYDMNFWSATFRLLVDGASQAPVTEVNEVVAADAVGDATFEWDTSPDIAELVLRIDDRVNEAVDVPLTTG